MHTDDSNEKKIFRTPTINAEVVAKYIDQKNLKCGSCGQHALTPVKTKSVTGQDSDAEKCLITNIQMALPMLREESSTPLFWAAVTGCTNCGHIQLFNYYHVLFDGTEEAHNG